MDLLSILFGPETMGWAAALLTLLTFFSADMRRLRLLALAANAAFIAYGTAAQLLPVLVLHMALVPVNLWRLNQSFRRGARTQPAHTASVQRIGRQPTGWATPRRGTRFSRRQAGSQFTPTHSDAETGTSVAINESRSAPCQALSIGRSR